MDPIVEKHCPLTTIGSLYYLSIEMESLEKEKETSHCSEGREKLKKYILKNYTR